MIKSDKVMKSGYGPSCASVPLTSSLRAGPVRAGMPRLAWSHALPCGHAFRPASPYLAAPADLSLARLPLVTEGHFVWQPSPARSRT